MMSMRSLALALVLMVVAVIPASAHVIDVDAVPDIIIVYPGSYNFTVVNVTVDSSGWYYIQFQVDDVDQPYIDANLSGPYLDPELTKPAFGFTWTGFNDSGGFSWTALSAGSYYFKLNVTADPNAEIGVAYRVVVSGLPGVDVLVKSDVVDILPIPELATIALSAVGLVAVGLIVMRKM